jgi:hypothetical protein
MMALNCINALEDTDTGCAIFMQKITSNERKIIGF